MNFFQAIFLGLVQALTEYLPVSSSAHIRIIGDLMLGSDPGAAFTAIIQIGTELAVILYFRHDIIRILGAWFGSLFGKEGKDFKSRMGAHNRDTQMGWFIIIGTLPILIAGLLFKDAIESTLRNLWITVTVLIIFGILLWVVDARAKQVKTMDEMTWKDALIFGIGQMLALIPGVSRSGGTITFGRAMGYTREAAVRVYLYSSRQLLFHELLHEVDLQLHEKRYSSYQPTAYPDLASKHHHPSNRCRYVQYRHTIPEESAPRHLE